MLYELSLYGIRGAILRWIRNFLSGRTQKVILNSQESKTTKVLTGQFSDLYYILMIGLMTYHPILNSTQMMHYYTEPSTLSQTPISYNMI